ncbi:MAG: M1 family aminopeptidase [Fuerstiella sp.]
MLLPCAAAVLLIAHAPADEWKPVLLADDHDSAPRQNLPLHSAPPVSAELHAVPPASAPLTSAPRASAPPSSAPRASALLSSTPSSSTTSSPVPAASRPYSSAVTTSAVESGTHQLPHYRMDIGLQTGRRRVTVNQTVRWTNTGTAPTQQLVFQTVANNKLSEEMIASGERTVESLRLEPRHSIDYQGRRFHLTGATVDDSRVSWSFSRRHDTHLHVQLPQAVEPGESVEVNLQYWIDIPPIMGRLGQHKGVTNLLNWYPVLAVYRGDAWQPVPYVPWHQPWHNEAGNYDVSLRLPADQRVVTGGHVVNRQITADGQQQLQIRGTGLRDFTIVASPRFQELTSEADGIPIRVQYLPEHKSHAEVALQTARESLLLYSRWFGRYPYREFELTESYFGWNGNESSGVVMIDERIFALPDYAARYIEHLVSHEICHQWWYSAVGTDGYHEPWMDEGLVTWFTRVKMEDKYGADARLLDVPGYGPLQFPNVEYRSLVHSGYSMYQGRGGRGASLGSLEEIGHLHNLFSLVYDRGARITGMIQHRMGRERFFEFMHGLFGKYRFRILTAADYQRELESFTDESWEDFFRKWLKSDASADWRLEDVTVTETADGYQTQARVTQSGTIMEPTEIGFAFEGDAKPFRLATLGESQQLQQDGVQVQQTAPNDWLVTIVSDEKPSQVVVDPDGHVVDSDPFNNTWRSEFSCRVTPFYTPVDEASLMQPWQQHGLVAGFGVDGEGRLGLRASMISSNRYRISPFLAYTAATASRNDDHLSAGVDAVVFNWPTSNWQLLARYEYALLSTLANDPGHQARIAVRRILNYTTSLIYPNLSYVDIYTRFGDNFFPDEDNTISADPRVEQFDNVRAFGVDFHIDSQMPYWDPDRGMRFDSNYEHGFQAFGGGATYDRVSGQLGAVQRLSSAPGWLSETKIAGRLAGGYGWSDNGEHFRFGGPGRFRGRDATATEGNAFWLSSLEWRFPVVGELDYQVLDNTAGLHQIDGSVFYDVGRSYLMDNAQGKVDHAVGLGMYFQIPLLSFVENLTVRTEYGYSLTNSTGAFWFGLYRAF